MPIPEQFSKYKHFVKGGEKELLEKLRKKTPNTESDIKWHAIVHDAYFAEENDELLVGYFQIPFVENNSNPGMPLPKIAKIPFELLTRDFSDDPEKVLAGLIIPVFFDVDWTLGMHSFYESEKIAKILQKDLATLKTEREKQAVNKEGLENFMQEMAAEKQKNKGELLNNPEDTAAVIHYLAKQPQFLVNIVSNSPYFVWVDLLLRLLTTYNEWGPQKNWCEIINEFSSGSTSKMLQMENILNNNLKRPGVIGCRLVCLVDDDEYRIIPAAQARGAKCFVASRKDNQYLIGLSNFLFLDLQIEARNSVQRSLKELEKPQESNSNEQAFFRSSKRQRRDLKQEEQDNCSLRPERISSSSSEEAEDIPSQDGPP